MNLIIDVGNTFIKLAVYADGEQKHKTSCERELFLECLSKVSELFPSQLDHCIVSTVGGFTAAQLSELRRQFPVFVLSHESKIPFVNKYATPKTLGVDRIALVSAAAVQYPKENVLVIDAGSCITYDFLNAKNAYLGGAISPGIEMRYKAMHAFTANLPLLEQRMPKTIIGNSTKNSMHIGVVQAIVHEIEGFIAQYQKDLDNLTVILTGGDAHFLRDSIKNDIFATSNFLLEGLNHILELNKD